MILATNILQEPLSPLRTRENQCLQRLPSTEWLLDFHRNPSTTSQRLPLRVPGRNASRCSLGAVQPRSALQGLTPSSKARQERFRDCNEVVNLRENFRKQILLSKERDMCFQDYHGVGRQLKVLQERYPALDTHRRSFQCLPDVWRLQTLKVGHQHHDCFSCYQF